MTDQTFPPETLEQRVQRLEKNLSALYVIVAGIYKGLTGKTIDQLLDEAITKAKEGQKK